MSFEQIARTLAPTLATGLLGPLGGVVTNIVAGILFPQADAAKLTTQDVVNRISSLADPADFARLKDAEAAVRKFEADNGFRFAQLDADSQQNARLMRTAGLASGNRTADAIAWWTLGSFLVIAALVLSVVVLALLRVLNIADNASVWAAASGLLGSVLGYFSANANQVVSFYFGSSAGSAAKTDQLAQHTSEVIAELGRSAREQASSSAPLGGAVVKLQQTPQGTTATVATSEPETGRLADSAIAASPRPGSAPDQGARPPVAGAVPTPRDGLDLQIIQIAAASPLIRFDWDKRGVAPPGYVKGMALAFARSYSKLKAGDEAASAMARAPIPGAEPDALAHYADIFAQARMRNDAGGADTLRHVFVLLIGLGMRESSGKYCEGRDRAATNVAADTAEAGLFQTSFNAHAAHPLLSELFNHYSANPSGFMDTFREGVQCSQESLESFGDGEGLAFQQLTKTCPAFAAEFAALGLRCIRTHWGPITRKEAQVRPEADAMLRQVQAALDQSPLLAAAVL